MAASNRYPIISNVAERKRWPFIAQSAAAILAKTQRYRAQLTSCLTLGNDETKTFPEAKDIKFAELVATGFFRKNRAGVWTYEGKIGESAENDKICFINPKTGTVKLIIGEITDETVGRPGDVGREATEGETIIIREKDISIDAFSVFFEPIRNKLIAFNPLVPIDKTSLEFKHGQTYHDGVGDTAAQIVTGKGITKKSVYLAHHAFPQNNDAVKPFIPFLSPLGAYIMIQSSEEAMTLSAVSGDPEKLHPDFCALVLNDTSLFLTKPHWKQNAIQETSSMRPTYFKALVHSIDGKTPVFTTPDLPFGDVETWLEKNHNQTVKVDLEKTFQEAFDAGKHVVIVVAEEPVQNVGTFEKTADPYGQGTFIRPSIMEGDFDQGSDKEKKESKFNSARQILAKCFYDDANKRKHGYSRNRINSNHRIHLRDVETVQSMLHFHKDSKIMTRNGTEFVLQTHANSLLFVHDFYDSKKAEFNSDSHVADPKLTDKTCTSLPLEDYSSALVYTDNDKTTAISSCANYRQRLKGRTKTVKFRKDPGTLKIVILETRNIDMALAENAVVAACIQHGVAGTKGATPTDGRPYKALTQTFVTTVKPAFVWSVNSPSKLTAKKFESETHLWDIAVETGHIKPELCTAYQWKASVTPGTLHAESHREKLVKAAYGNASKEAAVYAARASSAIAHQFYKTANLLVEESTQHQFKMNIVRAIMTNLRKAFAPEDYSDKFEGSSYVLLKAYGDLPSSKTERPLFIQPMAGYGKDIDSKRARVVAGISKPTERGIVAINSFQLRATSLEPDEGGKRPPGFEALSFPSESIPKPPAAEGDDGDDGKEAAFSKTNGFAGLDVNDLDPASGSDSDSDDDEGKTTIPNKTENDRPADNENDPPDAPPFAESALSPEDAAAAGMLEEAKSDYAFDKRTFSDDPRNSNIQFSVTGPSHMFRELTPIQKLDAKAYAIESGGFKHPKDARVFDTSKLKKADVDFDTLDLEDIKRKASPFEKFIMAPIFNDLVDPVTTIRPEDIVRTQSTNIGRIGNGFRMKLTYWYNQIAFRQYAASLQSALKRARTEAEEEAIDFPHQHHQNEFEQFALSTVQNNKQRIMQVTEYVQLIAFLMVASKRNGQHFLQQFISSPMNASEDPIRILKSFVQEKTKIIAKSNQKDTDAFAQETATIFKDLIESKASFVLLKTSRHIEQTEYTEAVIFDEEHEWAYGNKIIEAINAAFHAINLLVAHRHEGFSPYSIAKSLADSFAGWIFTPYKEPQPVAAVAAEASAVFENIEKAIKKNANVVVLKPKKEHKKSAEFYRLMYNGGNNPIKSVNTNTLLTQVTGHLIRDQSEPAQLVEIAGYVAKTPFFYAIQDTIMIGILQQAAKPLKQFAGTAKTIAAFIAKNPRENHKNLTIMLKQKNATDAILNSTAFAVNTSTLVRAFNAAAILQTMAADAGKRFKDPLAKQQSKQTLNQTIAAIVNGF